MATLAGNTIASTYPLLLKIDSSGIDGTLRAVQDGDATDSALSIATDSVLVKGSGIRLYFHDADGGEHIAGDGTDLTISSGNDIVLAVGSGGSVYSVGADGNTGNTVFGESTFNTSTNNASDNNVLIGKGVAGTGTVAGAIENTGVGYEALKNLTSGDENTMIGRLAGSVIGSGSGNVMIGSAAGYQAEEDVAQCVIIGRGAFNGVATDAANGTVAIGYGSLTALTSGQANVAIGYEALTTNTFGDKNVAVGHRAGKYYLPNENYGNSVFIGNIAGLNVTTARKATIIGNAAVGLGIMTGTSNTIIGNEAGYDLTSGTDNVMIGVEAGANTTDGSSNVYIGSGAADAIVSGAGNVVVGKDAFGGVAGSNANYNIAIGLDAMVGSSSSTGDANIGIGRGTLGAFTTGSNNVAVGYQSLDALLTGNYNTAIGHQALSDANGSESRNTAIGYQALTVMDGDGDGQNVALGYKSGHAITNGTDNTCLGHNTGGNDVNLTTGDQNIIIGSNSDVSTADAQNQIAIGYDTSGQGNNTAVIGNDSCTALYASSDAGATIHGGKLALGLARTDPTSILDVIGGGASGATMIIDNTQSANRLAELRIDGDNGSGDGGAMVSLYRNSGLKWSFYTRNNTDIGSAFSFALLDAGNDDGVYINQGGSGWTDASDERLKTSFVPIENAVDKLNTLQAINFKWKYGSEERQTKNNIGLLAQEVYEVFPEAVDYHDPEDFKLIDHPTIEGTKQAQSAWGIDKSKLIPVLVKAVQELSAKVKALEDA